jgi:hypothetical protein
MRRIIVLFLLIFSFITGCTKIPDTVRNLRVIIDSSDKGYSLRFKADIKNENINTAFTNIKGNILLLDENGDALESLDFTSSVILPLDTEVINTNVDKTLSQMQSILNILDIDIEKIDKNISESKEKSGNDNILIKQSAKEYRFNSSDFKLNIDSYEKEDIITLLKEKINEKN